MAYRKFWHKEEAPEYIEGNKYSAHQLELIADDILRKDGRRETCRECGEIGKETGNIQTISEGVFDDDGNELILSFPELRCPSGHTWYLGEGKSKGLKGDNPILFEEHLIARKRREIHNINGVPDPEIVSGSYWKSHPDGRKLSSESSRAKHGSAVYQ